MPDKVPSLWSADERRHHGVVEYGGELGADGGDGEGEEHERHEVDPAGGGEPEPATAPTSSTEKPAIHGLRGRPASAMAPSTGAMAAAISSPMPVA